MSDATVFRGSCFCGAVEFIVTGKPEAMGYCHCESCRHWSAGPVNAFTVWKADAVQLTRGADEISSYQKTTTSRSHRKWCKKCGGHLFTEHPDWGLNVYAALIPDLPFEPEVHVNYRESVLPIHDGIPKQADLPKEMGGSGELIAE